MTHYQIALIFSFITACFTVASSWTKDPSRSYAYQVAQCLVYAVAAYFYGVYPCIAMMLLNALRNYLVSVQKYKKMHAIVFSILALIIGVRINTSGIVGLLTVFATIQYSMCSYYMRREIPVKINAAFNLLLWFIYDVMVRDVFSASVDSISCVLAVITIFRILQDRKVQPDVGQVSV